MADRGEGVRERKRRETQQRISDAGMALFINQGYEATTIEDIAAAAGISRRTFFAYFASKDDILLSLDRAMGDMIVAALLANPKDGRPIDLVRDAIIEICARFPADDMVVIDGIMRASEAVQSRKQASYVRHEATLYAGLRERWPDPARETGLRLVAMAAMGAVRLSLEAFGRDGGTRPFVARLRDAFDALEKEL